jgi:periplasmic copper chaperone A
MAKRYLVFVLAAVAALVIAGLAEAHVTVHPNALPSGGFTVVNIRVPNERATANTAKVDVQFPSGFYSVDHQAVPGWRVKVIYRKLAKPITVNGQTQGQEVGRVVFTGKLPPKQFVDLPLSVAVPSRKAGTVLTFKALQTYSNGEIVRWIGPPGAATPAPQVKIVSANSPVADYPGGVGVIENTTRKTQSASLTPADGTAFAPLLGVGRRAAGGGAR